MTTAKERSQSRTAKWGWRILLVVSVLWVLNGVFWFFMGGSLWGFEQGTGVPLSEFRQAYPTVANGIAINARQVAIWYVAFGLLAMVVALEGFRHGTRWAWNATWVLVGAPAAIMVNVLVGGKGELVFAVSLLGYAALALVGQLLAGRGLAP